MKRVHVFSLAAAALLAAAPVRADEPGEGEVTGVSVVPAAGQASVVIGVRGAVEVRDFTLRNPDRLVVDVTGASLVTGGVAYDGVNRAGITNVRYSQFRPDVVRIVVHLTELRDYELEHEEDAIRISFDAEDSFHAWSSVPAAADLAAADLAAEPATPRTAALRTAGGFVPTPLRTELGAIREEPRITVTWDNADIADVVAGFAAFSGRTIILGKDIQGKVTAEIKNQPWHQAFLAVLATQGLSAQEMPGGIIRVDSPKALAALDSLEPLETAVVRINYARADSLLPSVEAVLTKGRGKVVADKGTNALIVTDTRSRLPNIEEFVRGLDVRTPQISIQAKIIFVDRTEIEELGFKYDIGDDNGNFFNKIVQRRKSDDEFYDKGSVIFGGEGLAAVGNADGTITGAALDLFFRTTIGGFSITSFIQALEQVNLADVQAEPVITTLDNRKADILVGEETPVRVIDASSQSGGNSAPRATVQFKETGIRLTVTPHVTNNRQILMEVHAERSAVQPLAASDLGFNFAKQAADNQILVEDGETAVIGGLTVTDVTKSRSGIPMLMNLPLIGKLFAYSKVNERRRDLIILVTPRIIDDGQELPSNQ
ncbi:MAG TPA: secretin N-terminal domain-containing protein [Gemmatimonadales bacterium]|nr:secretin N-terminal domain-containing protein [Gemmatimonadales bacterium]